LQYPDCKVVDGMTGLGETAVSVLAVEQCGTPQLLQGAHVHADRRRRQRQRLRGSREPPMLYRRAEDCQPYGVDNHVSRIDRERLSHLNQLEHASPIIIVIRLIYPAEFLSGPMLAARLRSIPF